MGPWQTQGATTAQRLAPAGYDGRAARRPAATARGCRGWPSDGCVGEAVAPGWCGPAHRAPQAAAGHGSVGNRTRRGVGLLRSCPVPRPEPDASSGLRGVVRTVRERRDRPAADLHGPSALVRFQRAHRPHGSPATRPGRTATGGGAASGRTCTGTGRTWMTSSPRPGATGRGTRPYGSVWGSRCTAVHLLWDEFRVARRRPRTGGFALRVQRDPATAAQAVEPTRMVLAAASVDFISRTAASRGLICFEPQAEFLLSTVAWVRTAGASPCQAAQPGRGAPCPEVAVPFPVVVARVAGEDRIHGVDGCAHVRKRERAGRLDVQELDLAVGGVSTRVDRRHEVSPATTVGRPAAPRPLARPAAFTAPTPRRGSHCEEGRRSERPGACAPRRARTGEGC